MRFIVLVKASEKSEQGIMPSAELFVEMGKFNEELVEAGIMKAGEGLHPSSKGARVHFSTGDPVVTDGPFTETKELVAGFWIWELPSLQDAIEWAKRIPNTDGEHGQVEIRQIFTAEDFGEALPAEVAEAEERMREALESQAS